MSRTDHTKHLFFDSIKWWKSRYDIFSKNDISVKKSSAIAYDPTCDLSILNEVPECKYIPSKTLTSAYLMNFFPTNLVHRARQLHLFNGSSSSLIRAYFRGDKSNENAQLLWNGNNSCVFI